MKAIYLPLFSHILENILCIVWYSKWYLTVLVNFFIFMEIFKENPIYHSTVKINSVVLSLSSVINTGAVPRTDLWVVLLWLIIMCL